MKTKEQIQSEIAKLQKELEEIKAKEKANHLVKIKLSSGTIEVERKLHLDMNKRDLIKIPEGEPFCYECMKCDKCSPECFELEED